jgi:hypothetical protein
MMDIWKQRLWNIEGVGGVLLRAGPSGNPRERGVWPIQGVVLRNGDTRTRLGDGAPKEDSEMERRSRR